MATEKLTGTVCFADRSQAECEIVIICGSYYARTKDNKQVPVVPHANLKGFYVEVPF